MSIISGGVILVEFDVNFSVKSVIQPRPLLTQKSSLDAETNISERDKR